MIRFFLSGRTVHFVAAFTAPSPGPSDSPWWHSGGVSHPSEMQWLSSRHCQTGYHLPQLILLTHQNSHCSVSWSTCLKEQKRKKKPECTCPVPDASIQFSPSNRKTESQYTQIPKEDDDCISKNTRFHRHSRTKTNDAKRWTTVALLFEHPIRRTLLGADTIQCESCSSSSSTAAHWTS